MDGGWTQGIWRDPRQANLQGLIGTWLKAKVGKGGANGRVIRRQMQAHGIGRIDKRRRLAGGGCGKRPGGWRSALGKEVGIGCDREVLQQGTLLMVGVSREEEIKRSRNRIR